MDPKDDTQAQPGPEAQAQPRDQSEAERIYNAGFEAGSSRSGDARKDILMAALPQIIAVLPQLFGEGQNSGRRTKRTETFRSYVYAMMATGMPWGAARDLAMDLLDAEDVAGPLAKEVVSHQTSDVSPNAPPGRPTPETQAH
jgi:hypothetical protein